MRIVHTADWHVGRTWKNLNRLGEMDAVLDHLARFIEKEKIDLLLMAGDVFENTSPSPEAERLVFRFFKRIGQGGTQSVVIAGNHDHPARLDAWGMLAELVGVQTVGKPRRADDGGVKEIATRCGETAVVAALPFAAVRTWVSAFDLAKDESQARQKYADMFRDAVAHLSQRFRSDTVNLLMAHTHLDGALLGGSERRVHLGEEWAATTQGLPSSAHYVALGHIHQPQQITAPAPTYYSGSPLQLDFGEAGQEKSFLLVEAAPQPIPARVERIPNEGGVPLRDLTMTLEEVKQRAQELASAGHLRITVRLAEADPDVSRTVRQLVPNAVVVHTEVPERPAAPTERPDGSAAPRELYRAYHRQAHGDDPKPEVEEAFDHLYQNAGGI